VRPAGATDAQAGLRLLAASGREPAEAAEVASYCDAARERGIDLSQMLIVEAGGRIVWAALPVVNPGRTAQLLVPRWASDDLPQIAIQEAVRRACEACAARGVQLVQALVDPTQGPLIDLLTACGMPRIAELSYMSRQLRRREGPGPLPDGFALQPYSADCHADLAQAIEESYTGSLDCPALNGCRDIEDVIAGHKAVGSRFDPSLWLLLRERGLVRGTLLLAHVGAGRGVELVYLGLTPAGRGRGLGDRLMAHAAWLAAERGATRLALAVDAQNKPALKLYMRHGMRRIGSTLALMQDLRPAALVR
jgi:ribosomal protein S18 acetylase RimI-like enzyme